MEQKVFHPQQLNQLKEQIRFFESKNIFVVRGGKSFVCSGSKDFINELLEDSSYTSFHEFETNPQLRDLKKGVALFNKQQHDLIIAIGGGSVIDMAKLISIFAHQKANYTDLVHGKAELENKKTPLLAIPTTAGSGAEATRFAVLYIEKNKYSVEHNLILPDYIYLSSKFSMTATPYLTACTGADAFSQAAEAIWSVNANEESINFAQESVRLIWKNLLLAVKENNQEAKQQLLKASYLAGKAINITKTTAPHALSYAFTSYYNIPHGHAVALSLPFFLHYNFNLTDSDCTDSRGAKTVKQRISKIIEILNCTEDSLKTTLTTFFESIGLEMEISKLIPFFDIHVIKSNVNLQRLNNNPRKVTNLVIEQFLQTSNTQ